MPSPGVSFSEELGVATASMVVLLFGCVQAELLMEAWKSHLRLNRQEADPGKSRFEIGSFLAEAAFPSHGGIPVAFLSHR